MKRHKTGKKGGIGVGKGAGYSKIKRGLFTSKFMEGGRVEGIFGSNGALGQAPFSIRSRRRKYMYGARFETRREKETGRAKDKKGKGVEKNSGGQDAGLGSSYKSTKCLVFDSSLRSFDQKKIIKQDTRII